MAVSTSCSVPTMVLWCAAGPRSGSSIHKECLNSSILGNEAVFAEIRFFLDDFSHFSIMCMYICKSKIIPFGKTILRNVDTYLKLQFLAMVAFFALIWTADTIKSHDCHPWQIWGGPAVQPIAKRFRVRRKNFLCANIARDASIALRLSGALRCYYYYMIGS